MVQKVSSSKIALQAKSGPADGRPYLRLMQILNAISCNIPKLRNKFVESF
jgi:hypothetical protein